MLSKMWLILMSAIGCHSVYRYWSMCLRKPKLYFRILYFIMSKCIECLLLFIELNCDLPVGVENWMIISKVMRQYTA